MMLMHFDIMYIFYKNNIMYLYILCIHQGPASLSGVLSVCFHVS